MPIPIRKTLFIGLGGFGKATLRSIRRKFYENFGFYEIPALQYLVLDTDNDPAALMYKSSYDSLDRHVAFKTGDQGEFLDISIERRALDDLYQDRTTDEVKDSLKWFDKSLQDLGSGVLEDGAGGIRSFGKLAFMLNLLDSKEIITRAIQHKLKTLHDLSNNDRLWEHVNNEFSLDIIDNRIDIFLFCSTAGGTGSGTFLDLSYYIKYLFANKKIDSTGRAEIRDYTLYLYLPDILLDDIKAQSAFKPPAVFEKKGITPQNLVKSGSYAALSELERYQLFLRNKFRFDAGWQGTEYFIPDWKPFKDIACSKPNDIFKGKRAFDWVYLIGNSSVEGHPLKGPEDAIEMTADKLYMLLIERQQDKLLTAYRANRFLYSLPEKVQISNSKNKKDYSRHYSGYGLSKIFIGVILIQRWAALYLADNFINKLLETEMIPESKIAHIVTNTFKNFSFNSQDIFVLFANEMLDNVRSSFTSLNSSNDFLDLIRKGIDFRPTTACYGKVNAVDMAFHTWKKEFENQNEFYKILEEILINDGIKSAAGFLDGLIDKIKEDIEIVKTNVSDNINSPGDFTEECQLWIYVVQNKFDWLGLYNQPKDKISCANIFKNTEVVLNHLKELDNIPVDVADLVRPTLKKRFIDYFLHARSAGGWANDFINNYKPQEIKVALNELRRGFVSMIKEVLTRVLNAQKIILEFFEKSRALLIDDKYTGNQKSLDAIFKYIISHEDKGHQTGLKPELDDLSREKNTDLRNIYCGTPYQNPDELKNPNPDNSIMAPIMKEGFGTKDSMGKIKPLKWLWELNNINALNNGIKQWISILIDKGITELKRKPTLKDYYENKQDKLFEDISHCLRTSSSYLCHQSGRHGLKLETSPKKIVIAPANFENETRNALDKIDRTIEISSYQGSELVFLTIEDGVLVPFLNIIDDLDKTYQNFQWPKAVWTRYGEPRELITSEEYLDIEIDIYLGIMIGSIWYDNATEQFMMKLEKKTFKGAEKSVSVGKSVYQVKRFFSIYGRKKYIEPNKRLKNTNLDKMTSIETLRKLKILFEYYETYYFASDDQNQDDSTLSAHAYIIEELKRRVDWKVNELIPGGDEQNIFSNESQKLFPWMHIFCDIVPILENADHREPDKDWLPILMKKWDPELSKRVLLWHNRNMSPSADKTDSLYNTRPYEFAMDADEKGKKGKDVSNWNEKDPTEIPEYIKNLAWPDQTEVNNNIPIDNIKVNNKNIDNTVEEFNDNGQNYESEVESKTENIKKVESIDNSIKDIKLTSIDNTIEDINNDQISDLDDESHLNNKSKTDEDSFDSLF